MSSTPACTRVFTLRNPASQSAQVYCVWQNSSGGFIATSFEGNPIVYIHNRQGVQQNTISLQGNCTALEWDVDGDYLAVLTEGSNIVILWESNSNKFFEVDCGVKDPTTCISWSKKGKSIVCGTAKGNLLIYNHSSLRKIPIIGKHTKKIVCSAWSNDNLIALGTIDNILSLNSNDGDTLKTIQLRGKPSDLKFGVIKDEKSSSHLENAMSTIVNDKTLYLLKYEDSQYTPMELGFQPRYGNIMAHHWHGDGYILVSFSAGFIVLISSHPKEIGSELILAELKTNPLRHSYLSENVSKLAYCAGETQVQIVDAANPRQVISVVDLSEDEERVKPAKKCQWNSDGQLLSVVTTIGDVHVYLTTIPLIGAAAPLHIAHMSSLTDINLYSFSDTNTNKSHLVSEKTYSLEIEPNIIALGLFHIAAACNNRIWYYNIGGGTGTNSNPDGENDPSSNPVLVKEFNSTIHDLNLNAEFSAARTKDKVFLHLIEGDGIDAKDSKIFPENDVKGWKITCHSLAKEVLIYGGDGGIFKVFHLTTWTEIYSLTTVQSIILKGIFQNPIGTDAVITDKGGNGFYFAIAKGKLRKLENFSTRCDKVFWDLDPSSSHIFVTYSSSSDSVNCFVVLKGTLYGNEYKNVGPSKIFPVGQNHLPLCLKDGIIISQSPYGKTLKSKSIIYNQSEESGDGIEGEEKKFQKLLIFKKFEDAFKLCEANDGIWWNTLKTHALRLMDIPMAMKATKMEGDLATLYCLKRDIENEEDWKLAASNVAMCLEEFDLAEKYFLESHNRLKALEMYLALQKWDKALVLARRFAPEKVSEISKEYASSMEFLGDFASALSLYEEALRNYREETPENSTNIFKCECGYARCLLRCGQISRGIEIVKKSESVQLKRECAEILEKEKQLELAAQLYEDCSQWDKAASIFIRLKQWNKVSVLIKNVKSNKIRIQFAKAKEAEGSLLEAASAYETANDFNNAIRLLVIAEKLDAAIRLVKSSESTIGAMHIARFFEKIGDLDTALRFLIISRCKEDALLIAFKNGKADLYVKIVEEENLLEEYKDGLRQIATYFEDLKDSFKAGKYYHICGENEKGFRLLIKAAKSGVNVDEDDLMTTLTKVAIGAKDEKISRTFIEFLLGEKDGIPKDPKYLLNFYIGSNRLHDASKVALIVSREEQNLGNYKDAHSTLLLTCRELKANGIKPTRDILEELLLVHSYYLSTIQANLHHFEKAARLLIRVQENISRFPKHATQILTSCVIFCEKAHLKASSMNALYTVMKPEFRPNIPPKFKAQFEKMIRKSGKLTHVDEPMDNSPCPYCDSPVLNYHSVCTMCRADIPFCIASGRHIVKDDLTACPNCEFPAIRSELIPLLEKDVKCPLCKEPFSIKSAALINDARPYLYFLPQE